MLFKLAWKNIWRNKKRTVIVSASVFFAVFLAIVMRSAQLGSYSYMIHSSAKMATGYLQVQAEGFWENRSLDKSYIANKEISDSILQINGVTSLTERLEAFALLSNDTITKVSPVVGINPDQEQHMTGLKDKLIEGDYLSGGKNHTLISEGLAKNLKVGIGDSLVLYGSGFHGQTAAAFLIVSGIVKLPLPFMNKAFAFINLPDAQYIYAAPGRITSASIMIENIRMLDRIKNSVKRMLKDNQTIMTWDEMLPELVQNIELDNASGLIMIGILYIVITLGVLGTIMMMTSEREKEFGILYSVGMNKIKMLIVSIMESVMVSFVGVIIGILGSIPLTIYLRDNPIPITGEGASTWESLGIEAIMTFTTDPGIYFWQGMIVLFIALLCASYPMIFIGFLNPTQAMRK